MMLTDREIVVQAFREAQIVLAEYVKPGPRNAEMTVQQLLEVLDRGDVVEAVERLETGTSEPA
jgi:hypothetical protein